MVGVDGDLDGALSEDEYVQSASNVTGLDLCPEAADLLVWYGATFEVVAVCGDCDDCDASSCSNPRRLPMPESPTPPTTTAAMTCSISVPHNDSR
jgi:hypothetical protein